MEQQYKISNKNKTNLQFKLVKKVLELSECDKVLRNIVIDYLKCSENNKLLCYQNKKMVMHLVHHLESLDNPNVAKNKYGSDSNNWDYNDKELENYILFLVDL